MRIDSNQTECLLKIVLGNKGTGLGLSISHGILEDHGGDLTVETEVGEWTRFHADLPLESTND